MTISLPGHPLDVSDPATAGAVRLPFRTVVADDGCERTDAEAMTAGNFVVDWQLVLATGAQW